MNLKCRILGHQWHISNYRNFNTKYYVLCKCGRCGHIQTVDYDLEEFKK